MRLYPSAGVFAGVGDHQRVPGFRRTEARWVGFNPQAREIKPVGVPAAFDRHVMMVVLVGMTIERGDQNEKFSVIQIEITLPDVACEEGGPRAVLGIAPVVAAASVVQEGKVFDDARVVAVAPSQHQAVVPDPRPVGDAMNTVPVKNKFFSEEINQLGAYRCSCSAVVLRH